MKTILVAPLNWGLGHATRCIPLIAQLRAMGHRVLVAADGAALERLRGQFDGIEWLRLPSYRVRYSAGRSQLWPMLWVALRLPLCNMLEHMWLCRFVRRHAVDMVLSDNRYGLWSRRCTCVCITHQLRVLPPPPFGWAEGMVAAMLRRWLRRFSAVWMPDHEGSPLAGRLSAHNGLPNLRYIGPLSRFDGLNRAELPEPPCDFDLLVVASGPEPHRQQLIDGAADLARVHGLRCLVIEGNQLNGSCLRGDGLVRFVGHLPDAEFAAAVLRARYMLLRGGYSSIMDMLSLGVSGLLVPTPGQTEQEHLAEHLAHQGLFRAVSQDQLFQLRTEQLRANRQSPMCGLDLAAVIDGELG